MVCALPWTGSGSVASCFIYRLLSSLALKSGHSLSRYVLGSHAIPSWTHLWGTWMGNNNTTNPLWLLYDNIYYCSNGTAVTTKPNGKPLASTVPSLEF